MVERERETPKKVMTFYGCGYLLFCHSSPCPTLPLVLMLCLTLGEVISMRVALPAWTFGP